MVMLWTLWIIPGCQMNWRCRIQNILHVGVGTCFVRLVSTLNWASPKSVDGLSSVLQWNTLYNKLLYNKFLDIAKQWPQPCATVPHGKLFWYNKFLLITNSLDQIFWFVIWVFHCSSYYSSPWTVDWLSSVLVHIIPVHGLCGLAQLIAPWNNKPCPLQTMISCHAHFRLWFPAMPTSDYDFLPCPLQTMISCHAHFQKRTTPPVVQQGNLQ